MSILTTDEVDIEDTHYLTIVNVMTYKEDGDMVYWCLRSVLDVFRKVPVEIYVMDDSNNPMDAVQVERILSLDPCVKYERTTFERNRNLNGRSCVVGMMEKFVEHAAGREALNIKIDPDTILLGRRIFNEFWNIENTGYCASSRPGCYFSGVVYMWKSDAAERALEIINKGGIDHLPEDKGPEDFIIGVLLSLGALPRLSTLIRSWDNDAKKGYSAAWPFSITEAQHDSCVALYYKLYDFVTMGNWFAYREKGITKEHRIKPAKALVELYESNNKITRK